MLLYGKKQGAKEASAIVTVNNIVSQHMIKKNGFEVVLKWAYYEVTPKEVIRKIDHMKMRRRTVKITSLKDINELWSYLINSKVYRLSGRRCVSVWRWYCLDHTSLERFIEVKRLVITYDSLIAGVAIINKSHVS